MEKSIDITFYPDSCDCEICKNIRVNIQAQQDSVSDSPKIRTFETGATRNPEKTFDPEGFMSPLAVRRFCQYMEENRRMADGSLRPSDNWQKGIPLEAYMKSEWRHFLDMWERHRNNDYGFDMERTLCAVIFNASGYLHEILKLEKNSPGE